MHHNFRADKCKLVGDEDGWVLEIETDEGDDLRINIHSCAWEFADTLGSLLEEMRDVAWARRQVALGIGPNGEQLDDGGYEPTDPKHRDFHSLFAGEADDLRKREKEQRADWIDPPGRK